MARYSVDCREIPSDNNCDVKISGSEGHLVEAAAVLMVAHHGHAGTPGLRKKIRTTKKPEADE